MRLSARTPAARSGRASSCSAPSRAPAAGGRTFACLRLRGPGVVALVASDADAGRGSSSGARVIATGTEAAISEATVRLLAIAGWAWMVGSARPPPLPRDATDTPVTATSAATPAARTLVWRELFRKTASRRGSCALAHAGHDPDESREPQRRPSRCNRGDPDGGRQPSPGRCDGGVNLRQAVAADTAADARQAASRRAASARGCWEISGRDGGSRSSNRIGSAGGTGTSGGAAAKNPCSSSSQGASSVRSESLATSG